MEKHFVTFLSPGTLFNEETTKAIDSWDVDKAVEMSRQISERYNAKPYAFQFSTRARNDDELDSKVVARSGRYFLGGTVLTLDDVKARNDPSDRVLIANMEGNGWNRIIENNNSWKVTQPLLADDVVLDYEVKAA